MRSWFRPSEPVRLAALEESRGVVESMTRRRLIRGGLSLGALTMLTGCDVYKPEAVESVLHAMSDWNDWVQAKIFDQDRLAPTFPASMVQRPPKFNAYYDIKDVKPVDGTAWRLEVAGLVTQRKAWTLDDLRALPQTDMVIRHICIEGWDYIGEWSGPTLRGFLERCGADLTARYVLFDTADNYPSVLDMATALHPQTLLALTYGGETLPDPYGYPVRLRTSTKLGFKNPKWITRIEVSNTYRPGYWEKLGYNYFSGI